MIYIALSVLVYVKFVTDADCSTFLCNDGECLPYSYWVCDGEGDCSGSEDEVGCGGASNSTTSSSPSTEQSSTTQGIVK